MFTSQKLEISHTAILINTCERRYARRLLTSDVFRSIVWQITGHLGSYINTQSPKNRGTTQYEIE